MIEILPLSPIKNNTSETLSRVFFRICLHNTFNKPPHHSQYTTTGHTDLLGFTKPVKSINNISIKLLYREGKHFLSKFQWLFFLWGMIFFDHLEQVRKVGGHSKQELFEINSKSL